MELLTAQNREEYEAFVSTHPAGEFTQSLRWPQVKNNWGYEGIISRAKDGTIRGAMLVLIQRIPLIGTSFLYAPRGPICDLHDKETLADLMAGVDQLAQKHKAHAFKVDPNLLFRDTEAVRRCYPSFPLSLSNLENRPNNNYIHHRQFHNRDCSHCDGTVHRDSWGLIFLPAVPFSDLQRPLLTKVYHAE